MKIYIASSFDLAHLCEAVYRLLTAKGHEVPDVWWNIREKDNFKKTDDTKFYGASIVQSIAARHWRTLQEVDCVILISGDVERTFTGANVEVGYALGIGKPVLSLGKLKRSAMYVPIIKCEDTIELLKAIQCIGQVQR